MEMANLPLDSNPAAGGGNTSLENGGASSSSSLFSTDFQLPPGFRFHPTDEELVVHYLSRKLACHAFKPMPIVTELDLYKFDPWELPQQAAFGEKEWYFFSPRDRKYPNGVRPNRAAASGYWKATGTDKIIHSSTDGRKIGVKKALVFYKGRAPKGIKSNWIMHEYRLIDASNKALAARKKGSLRLDDWVLCRIYKKKAKSYSRATKTLESNSASMRRGGLPMEEDILATLPEIEGHSHANNDPFMQVLLSGPGGNRQPRPGYLMNSLLPIELQLMRSRQQHQHQHQQPQLPTTTEMLFPSSWQTMLSSKDDQSQSTTASLGLLENLQRQHQQVMAGGVPGISLQQPEHFHPPPHLGFEQQPHGEVVDETFTGSRVLFPPNHMEYTTTNNNNTNTSNNFSIHTGPY